MAINWGNVARKTGRLLKSGGKFLGRTATRSFSAAVPKDVRNLVLGKKK